MILSRNLKPVIQAMLIYLWYLANGSGMNVPLRSRENKTNIKNMEAKSHQFELDPIAFAQTKHPCQTWSAAHLYQSQYQLLQ
jgi:hypothetical protein